MLFDFGGFAPRTAPVPPDVLGSDVPQPQDVSQPEDVGPAPGRGPNDVVPSPVAVSWPKRIEKW